MKRLAAVAVLQFSTFHILLRLDQMCGWSRI